jgi:hypothetical protein
VGRDGVQFGDGPTFWSNISPPSSGSNHGNNQQDVKQQTSNFIFNSAPRMFLLASCLTYSSALKMEAICGPVTLGCL